MKKIPLFIIAFLLIALPLWAIPPSPPSTGGSGISTASDCNVAAYFTIGKLCQDTDDGKLYKGTGAAVVEIAAGASGDVVAAAASQTWGDGTGPVVWTFGVTGTDPTITATTGSFAFNTALALGANNITSTGSLGATGAGKLTKGWFVDAEFTNYPTVNGGVVFNQAVTSTSNPAFSTINVVGTNSLNLGSAGSLVGQVTFKNATSGGITVQPITGALGTPTLVLGTTYTDTKWCSYATATGFTCAENAPSATQAGLHVDDLLTAVGIASEATHMGTFTGSTIADNQTAKVGLQSLETAVEAALAPADIGTTVQAYNANLDTVSTGGAINTLFGINAAGAYGYYANHLHDDSAAQISNAASPTKLVRFLASSVTAGQTSEVTVPDGDGIMAYVKTEKLAVFTWDGGASALTAAAGTKRCVFVPAASTLTGLYASAQAEPTANITIALFKDAFSAAGHATTAMISGTNAVVIPSAGSVMNVNDTTLTGVTVAVAAGDQICATITATDTATWLQLTLYGTK